MVLGSATSPTTSRTDLRPPLLVITSTWVPTNFPLEGKGWSGWIPWLSKTMLTTANRCYPHRGVLTKLKPSRVVAEGDLHSIRASLTRRASNHLRGIHLQVEGHIADTSLPPILCSFTKLMEALRKPTIARRPLLQTGQTILIIRSLEAHTTCPMLQAQDPMSQHLHQIART